LCQRNIDNAIGIISKNVISLSKDKYFPIQQASASNVFIGHLHFKAVHISSVNNAIADSLSRGQFQKFRELAPPAELKPMTMPWECFPSIISFICF
jgi:hypothetical protein